MASVSITIKNISQIKKAFGLAPSLMRNELNKAIRLAVLAIGRDSRRLTPVDTGRLRASTYEKFSNLQGEIGTNTEYDLFVHEGTRFMRARPYLRNAVRMNDVQIQSYFNSAVDAVLKEVGKQT